MCHDEAMSTGHDRFINCRKLNQTSGGAEGKAKAVEHLLREIEAEKVERAACETSVRKCIESAETSCMKASPCAGCGCMATGLVVSTLSQGGCESLRVSVESEQSMEQEMAMLSLQRANGHLAKQCSLMQNLPTNTVHGHNGRLYHLDRAGCGSLR